MNTLQGTSGHRIAYIKTEGTQDLSVIFLGGYRSDMMGTKAAFLENLCKEIGYNFIRFDYMGHGQSEGAFKDGTISTWTQDALDIINHAESNNIILIGSSMGGWIGLLCALKRPEIIKGMIGIAAAPDFTTWIEARLSPENKDNLARQGYFEEANEYTDEPYMFTQALLDNGRENTLLDKDIPLDIPIALLQGKEDTAVPWQTAEKIKNAITGKNVHITYIDDGTHNLSRDQDLEILKKTLLDLTSEF